MNAKKFEEFKRAFKKVIKIKKYFNYNKRSFSHKKYIY